MNHIQVEIKTEGGTSDNKVMHSNRTSQNKLRRGNNIFQINIKQIVQCTHINGSVGKNELL